MSESQAKVTTTVSRKFGITSTVYLHMVFNYKEHLSHCRGLFSEKPGVDLESHWLSSDASGPTPTKFAR